MLEEEIERRIGNQRRKTCIAIQTYISVWNEANLLFRLRMFQRIIWATATTYSRSWNKDGLYYCYRRSEVDCFFYYENRIERFMNQSGRLKLSLINECSITASQRPRELIVMSSKTLKISLCRFAGFHQYYALIGTLVWFDTHTAYSTRVCTHVVPCCCRNEGKLLQLQAVCR